LGGDDGGNENTTCKKGIKRVKTNKGEDQIEKQHVDDSKKKEKTVFRIKRGEPPVVKDPADQPTSSP